MAERRYRYLRIADQLEHSIVSGDISSGSLLPSESDLSTTYEASRVTIRRALEELRSSGLVDSRQGFGWFVRSEPLRQSLDELGSIEGQLRANGAQTDRRILGFGLVETPSAVTEVIAEPSVLEVRRLNLANGEPYALITVWCRSDVGSRLSLAEVEERSFLDLLGDRVGSAVQTIGARHADRTVAEELRIVSGAALLRVWRVTSDESGHALFVSEQLYPATSMEFEITIDMATSEEPGSLRPSHSLVRPTPSTS